MTFLQRLRSLRTPALSFGALSLGALASAPSALADIIYVDANLTTGLGDGTSWADAYQGVDGLSAALLTTVSGDMVFVADGRYRPTSGTARAQSFNLQNGVELYGGFSGGEASLAERPAFGAAPSVLDGDLLGDDASNLFNDNSYHVVRTAGTNSTAVLDGFVVRGGNANGGGSSNDRGAGILIIGGVSPTIRSCEFIANRCTFGGGAGYINASAPRFTDCRFIDNIGGSFGGAFDIATAGSVRFDRCYFEGNSAARAGALEIFATSGVIVTNSIFYDNLATGGSAGGGLWIGSGGNTQLRNCTIVGNRATGSSSGGGLANSGGNPSVINCIFWDNSAAGGAQTSAAQVSAGTSVTYSIVEFGYTGAGNVALDPQLTDVATRDFSLLPTSPAIDAGNNSGVPAGIMGDFLGRRRMFDAPTVPDTGIGSAPVVDIGAHEYTTNIGAVFCSANTNSSALVGRLDAVGSEALVDNDVTLVATSLPANSNGFFLTSRAQGFVANPGGSTGNLCLGGAIGRYVGPGQIQNSGAAGTFSLVLDVVALPQPNGVVAAQAGETWNFQAWYRDQVLGFPTSNFTDGASITFR
ncbi:MAG: right-handed parallel beta-helix repeat-containing protein [Planctomycetota bacterium]